LSTFLYGKADNSFIRRKWGIYRSLKAPSALRDVSLRFAGFSIEEVLLTSPKLITEK